MATAKCFSLVGGTALRATALDGCGRPKYGDCAQVVSDGFISVAATANVDEGDTIDVKNAGGKSCVFRKPCPTLQDYSVEVQFCEVDPDLFAIMTAQKTVRDPRTGDAIGFRVNVDVDACDAGVSLEVWSEVPGVVCGPEDEEGIWGYTLLPFLQGGVFGDYTIENDAVTFTVTGASTKSGSGWDRGPYNIALDGTGAPAGLADPIDKGDHIHVQLVNIAPPAPTCGCVPLDNPTAPPSTGATAGSPGVWTPTGSNRPDTLADLQASTVTASPTTAWAADEFVVVEDGSAATWDGTGWVAFAG